jgi:pterin-4a-carbinolamine dehydratase
MKRLLITIIAATAVGGATLFCAMPRSTAEEPDHHPEIHAAIHSLERAKFHLEHAAHDFGGHRKDAVLATDEAIKQLRIALEYDKE